MSMQPRQSPDPTFGGVLIPLCGGMGSEHHHKAIPDPRERGIVAVGSRNPVKITATRQAFDQLWSGIHWTVSGCDVSSISQPMSDIETRNGAIARAHWARQHLDADFGAGLESGLSCVEGYWFNCGWVAVISRSGIIGLATTMRLAVPKALMDLVHQGHELGTACDIYFGGTNNKQKLGHPGLMSSGAIDRTGIFHTAVIGALSDLVFGTTLGQLMRRGVGVPQ